jgi:hypothetical protein
MQLKRTHADGMVCSILEEYACRRVTIRFRKDGEPSAFSIVGMYKPTLQIAKEYADNTVATLSSGHVCDASCKGWEVVSA